jgi:hypothetical protein
MSHWAEIDANNIVLRVVTGDNNEPDEGYGWLIDNLGGTWLQTSYHGNIRYNYAGIGFIYDPVRDAFIAPEPADAIGFDEETCQWITPEPESYLEASPE